MPRSPHEVDVWIRDHESQHAREREERKLEDGRLIDAVKKHVDGAVKPIVEMNAKLDALAKVNDEQLAIARESAEERGRRKEREEAIAKKKSDDELALAQSKLDAETKARTDAQAIEKLKAKNDTWKIVAGVVTAIAVAVISALWAAHK